MSRNDELIDGFDELCRRSHDLPGLLARADTDEHPQRSDVKDLLDFGCLALALPEADGGPGMGPVDLASLFMSAGRYLLPLHLTNAMVLAGPATAGAPGALLDDLVQARISLASGLSSTGDAGGTWPAWVPSDAELLVTAGPSRLALYRLDDSWQFTDTTALDPGQGLRLVQTRAREPVPVAAVDGEVARRAWHLWQLSLCAQALGCAAHSLQRSTEYARAREQFGKPIASFQAVAHTLAEMYVSVTTAESMLSRTAHSLESDLAEAPRNLASLAHWLPARTRSVCEQAIQVHGGTGFTWELGLHLYYRRVLTVQSLLGGSRGSARQVAAVGR